MQREKRKPDVRKLKQFIYNKIGNHRCNHAYVLELPGAEVVSNRADLLGTPNTTVRFKFGDAWLLAVWRFGPHGYEWQRIWT